MNSSDSNSNYLSFLQVMKRLYLNIFGVINIIDLSLTLVIAILVKPFLHKYLEKSNNKRALNFGAELYQLYNKGNINHVNSLYNPSGIFERVYTICYDPKSLYTPVYPEWLNPVMLKRPHFYWWQFIQLLRVCLINRIGLIRCRGPYEYAAVALCLKLALKIPIILSTGGNHRLAQELSKKYNFHNPQLSFLVEELAYCHSDLIYCINQYTCHIIKELGGGRNNTLVFNPIRIDTSLFNPDSHDKMAIRKAKGIKDDTKIVMFTGRLERDKEVDILFTAIPSIIAVFPSVIFNIIGDGSLRESLKRQAVEHGIDEKVVFLGFKPNGELPIYYALSDIVVIPVSGFVIYEAAAMQKPIVAFDVDWHAEFIKNGVTGLLVPNKDVVKLVEAIISLLRDEKLSMQLAQNARIKFLREFDPVMWEQKEKKIIEQFIRDYIPEKRN